MRAFVTGATGFLGTALCAALRERGHHVVGLIHDGHAGREAHWDDWAKGDVRDLPLIERILAGYEIDTVFHLAAQAQTSIAFNNPVGTMETNAMGTLSVLEAARRQKTKRVVIASTDKVYGEHKLPCTETFSLDGFGPYEVSKVCADEIAQSYARMYGMSVGITRCANLYGPGHRNLSCLIPGTIYRVLTGKAPRLYGNGASVREFLYIDDAVDAYIAFAESAIVGPMNFGSGEALSIADVVQYILKELDSGATPELLPARGDEIKFQRLDSSKARASLAWLPSTTFEGGIEKTCEWHKELVECA